MSTASNSHHLAMDLVELAVLERVRGNVERTEQLYAQALELEMAAIQELHERNDFTEPTWSVLHRSAGWMAFNSSQPRLAEQLACKALARDPHPEIAEELRDLLEQVNSQRHLALQGVTLTADEMQMNLAGPAVGFGRVGVSDYISRIRDLTKFIHRIIENRQVRPFRESGPRQGVIDAYPTFVSLPRPGSFSATITIGQPTEQLSFANMLTTNVIVDEFMDVMEFAKVAKMSELQGRVSSTPYLRNFIGLARRLAPDGNRIKQVGFTTLSDGRERYLSIDIPASEFPLPPVVEVSLPPMMESEAVVIRGVLRYADGIKDNTIKIVDHLQNEHTIEIPQGMMSDVVGPNWNSNVTISGVRIGGKVTLRDILPYEASSPSVLY